MEADDEEQDEDDQDVDEETLDDLSQEGKNSVSKIIIKQDNNGMRSFFLTLISTCFRVKNAFLKNSYSIEQTRSFACSRPNKNSTSLTIKKWR
jgi:hypothetical protein